MIHDTISQMCMKKSCKKGGKKLSKINLPYDIIASQLKSGYNCKEAITMVFCCHERKVKLVCYGLAIIARTGQRFDNMKMLVKIGGCYDFRD